MFRLIRYPVALVLAILIPGLADATSGASSAEQPTARLHATVRAVSGADIVLDLPDGTSIPAKLDEHVRVTGVRRASFADIRQGSFVGAAALPGADGQLRALEVHIFAESMRGSGEGHRPMDQAAHKTMTNGTVGVVSAGGANTITVTYGGGEQRLLVQPETPVVALEPADTGLIAAGARVSATVRQDPTGGVLIERILVGIDGLDPPL